MNNTVVLYKTKYTLTSYEQPYFLTAQTRDLYLSVCSPYTVPLVQPNIKFGINLDLELVIPIDYTIAQGYNFAKITYNSKDYYAYIVDMELVSVGNVRAYMHRAVLFENPNYLSNFKNFNVSKATFTSGYSYNRNTAFFKPDFRYYRRFKSLTPSYEKYYYRNNTKALQTYNVAFQRVAILFFSEIPARFGQWTPNSRDYNIKNFYGNEVQFCCCVIPLKDDKNTSVVTFDVVNTVTNDFIDESNVSSTKYYPDLSDILDAVGPYLISAKIVNLPVAELVKPIMPFFYYKTPLKLSREGFATKTIGYMLYSTSCHLRSILDEKVTINYEFDSPFGASRIFLYSYGNYIELDKAVYSDGEDNGCYIDLWYFHNSTDTSICVSLTPLGADSVEMSLFGTGAKDNLGAIQTVLELSADMQYILTSEANFNAQNSYYDAMTANVKTEKYARGMTQAAENFALGFTQLWGAGKMIGNYSIDLQTAGASNIIRGVGKTVDTILDAEYYSQQRNIYKKNEQNKPDEAFGSSNGLSNAFQSAQGFYAVEEIPFTKDYEEWQSNIKIFGIECNLFESAIDLSSKIVDNNFFLQAVATMADSAKLDQPTFSELFNILTKGCVYNYYQT